MDTKIKYLVVSFVTLLVLFFVGASVARAFFFFISITNIPLAPTIQEAPKVPVQPSFEPRKMVSEMNALVTGYNTVPEQTDSTPCIAANGENICGLTNVVACPRIIPFDTEVEIDGEIYRCVDRLAEKYDNRFDISCDKDMQCPARVMGYKDVKILELKVDDESVIINMPDEPQVEESQEEEEVAKVDGDEGSDEGGE